MKYCAIFCLLIIIFQTNAAIYRLSDEEYELMPPIISMDPFEECLRQPGGLYCTAIVAYVADEPSPLLRMMQEYSAHTASHFNHTRSYHGTCLTRKCKNITSNTTLDQTGAFEACLNQTMWEKYKLKTKIEEEVSCHVHNEERFSIETADLVVAGVVLALVIFNIIGSLFDIYCYKNDRTVTQFLLCFSIPRNRKKLMASPGGADPRLTRLRGIQGLRAIFMTLIIIGHGMLPSILLPENPAFIEDQYARYPLHLLLNGTVVMQMFLFISGFLLAYNTLLHTERHQLTWNMLPMAISRRWLRLTPPYALVLAVTATWLKFLATGPVWNLIVVNESNSCRRDWWKYVLYINNFDDETYCMPQAWYLATDTQLFVLGVLVLVCCKTTQSRNRVLSLLFLAGISISALHTYFQDLDGTVIVSPTSGNNFFRTDPTFNSVYKRGHTNLPSYVIGIASAFLLYHLQNINFDITKYRRWRPLYWCSPVLGVVTVLSFKTFYEEGPRVSLLYRVILSVLVKPFFGLIFAFGILGLFLEYENVYRKIFEWSAWTSLGRVSYSAYLLHVAVIRAIAGSRRTALQSSYTSMAESVMYIVTVTYIYAYLFFLTVEAPLGQVVKTFIERPHHQTNGTKSTSSAADDTTEKKEIEQENKNK